MKNIIKKRNKSILSILITSLIFTCVIGFVLLTGGMTVNAVTTSSNSSNKPPVPYSVSVDVLTETDGSQLIDLKDREAAYYVLVEYISNLKVLYNISDDKEAELNEILYEMVSYTANTQMTLTQLNQLVTDTKSNLYNAISDGSESMVFMANDVAISSGWSGGSCVVNLGLINLGSRDISNLVVFPVQDGDPSKWPFVINTASDSRVISKLVAGNSMSAAYEGKQTVSWTFTVSGEAKTGLYPLTFKYQYYSNGKLTSGTITTFANIHGASENGKLIDNGEDTNTSTPRIIVTGFTTDPENVQAGDSFTLNLEVENTSATETVSNIQFDLKAVPVAISTTESIEAFLPTSGSSTIYVDSIAPKGTTTLTMEFTARADLNQQPYVINVSAKYEDSSNKSYEATSNVSVPVNQEARVEVSDFEVLPDYIMVGETSNIMFDVYNMGKTTLFNVQVAFDENYLSGTKFVGKVESGGTGAVDMDVTGVTPCYDGYVTVYVTYEDDAGNATVIEKQVPITIDEAVYEEYSEDYGMYEDMGEMEGETTGPNIGLIIGIIVAIIVAVIVVIRIIKKNKAKKEARKRELEEMEKDDTLL